MSLLSYVTVLLGLWALPLASALPAPVRDVRQAVGILKVLLSQSSGKLVAVDLDGNVSANSLDFGERSHFDHRTGDYHVFESAFLNGSFLHLAQLENGSGNGTTNSTIDFLRLRVGDITNNQTHLHHWHEELSGGYFRYYVTLEEGVNCYLAFETDGSPVEDPCAGDLDLNKALFQLWVLQESS